MPVLVTDRVYRKTLRYLGKLKAAAPNEQLHIAIVDGFSSEPDAFDLSPHVDGIIRGDIQGVAAAIHKLVDRRLVALNQSGLLPAAALALTSGREPRPGMLAACDKSAMRRTLMAHPRLALEHRVAVPGVPGSAGAPFEAERFVVKPVFGMSSSDVQFFQTYQEAAAYAESTVNQRRWLPTHLEREFGARLPESNARIIEPFIEGTEFSFDGWLTQHHRFAIVHHKLAMVCSTYVGDGPTISPPTANVPSGYSALRSSEAAICEFGFDVLNAIGFSSGVFHLEGRERPDGRLCVLEVNARAPGGSLWRSAEFRTGFDLEAIDARIQLDLPVAPASQGLNPHVLHLPFYAKNTGTLTSWGNLAETEKPRWASIDFAVELSANFDDADLLEEPYLAFVVTHAPSHQELMKRCEELLALDPPVVTPHRAEPIDLIKAPRIVGAR